VNPALLVMNRQESGQRTYQARIIKTLPALDAPFSLMRIAKENKTMTMTRPGGHGRPNQADRDEIQGCWNVVGTIFLVLLSLALAAMIAN